MSSTLAFNESYCSKTTVAIDIVPKRSPQTVHSLLKVLTEGKDVVEIGTRVGDGLLCWAATARSTTAFEVDGTYCRGLARRLKNYPRKVNVTCRSFLKEQQSDGDVFTWWNQPPQLLNDAVLDHLHRLQKAKAVRDTAVALPLFELGHWRDHAAFERLKNVSRAHHVVKYNEVAQCLKTASGAARHLCSRAKGSFGVAEIVVADWTPSWVLSSACPPRRSGTDFASRRSRTAPNKGGCQRTRTLYGTRS